MCRAGFGLGWVLQPRGDMAAARLPREDSRSRVRPSRATVSSSARAFVGAQRLPAALHPASGWNAGGLQAHVARASPRSSSEAPSSRSVTSRNTFSRLAPYAHRPYPAAWTFWSIAASSSSVGLPAVMAPSKKVRPGFELLLSPPMPRMMPPSICQRVITSGVGPS
jgi:hypothetical protein